MHRRPFRLALLAPALLMASASLAEAQVELVNRNFDTPADYQYGYAFAGGGLPQTDRSGLTSSTAGYDFVGVDDSRAFYVRGDFSELAGATPFPDYNYSGFGGGIGNFFMDWANNRPLGLPSPNPADYSGSVDLRAAGFPSGSVPTDIQFQFQVPDDFFTPDADTNATPFANINIPVRVGSEFETFTFTLDQVDVQFDEAVPEAERDFAKHYQNIGLLNLNFNVDAAGGGAGNDDDNFLYVDNFVLTAVPEPGSAGLLLGGFALALRRRRLRCA